jgi:hypothetical protein
MRLLLRFLLLLTVTSVGPSLLPAQSAPTPSARPCSSAEFRQFDFWAGSWDVEVKGKIVGRNDVTIEQDGCLLVEHWKSLMSPETGTSFNYYDKAGHQWHQLYIANNGNARSFPPIAGGLQNGAMVLTNDADPSHTARWTWTPLPEDRVRQMAEQSADGGKSWKVVWDSVYIKRSSSQTSEPSAAPLDHIDASTPRDIQIRLAKSAAPADISDHATLMVLGKNGYETAVSGSNGFTCLVLRQRLDTLEPECYDAEGSRTTLHADLFIEEQRAKGVAEDVIEKAVDAGYQSGRFKAPAKSGIVYMLSPHTRVYDPELKKVIAVSGHLMFYAPYATAQTVGSGKGAPYIANPGKPSALMIVVPR